MTCRGDADRLASVAALLQIADSAFPVGGYAESSGVEALVRGGCITDQLSLQNFLGAHRRLSIDRCEVWFARNAHSAVVGERFEALPALAVRENISRPVLLQRNASARVGAALLDRACHAFRHEGDAAMLDLIREALGQLRPIATVSGAVVAALGGNSDDAADLITYTTLCPMATAAVRLSAVSALQACAALAAVLAQESEPNPLPARPATASLLVDVALMEHEVMSMPSFRS